MFFSSKKKEDPAPPAATVVSANDPPGKMIRDAVDEPAEISGVVESAKENWDKLIDGIAFSLGFNRGRTWFMIFATAFATFGCSEFVLDLSFNTSLSIVAVGTVFPVVFSINAAYQNREKALRYLDSVKSGLIYTYFEFVQWDEHFGSKNAAEVEMTICKLVVDMIRVLKDCPATEEEQEKVYELTGQVYDGFHKIISCAHSNSKVPPPVINGQQMMIKGMMADFTSVKTVKDMETPRGLRKLCFFLIITTPILLAPYWAHFCRSGDHSDLDLMDYGCAAAYFIGLLYVIISSTLLRVQECLEDPFDGDGEDDINWHLFLKQLDQLPLHGSDGPKLREEEEAEARRLEEAAKAAAGEEAGDSDKKGA